MSKHRGFFSGRFSIISAGLSCVGTNPKTLLWEAPCSLWNIPSPVLVKEIPSSTLFIFFESCSCAAGRAQSPLEESTAKCT